MRFFLWSDLWLPNLIHSLLRSFYLGYRYLFPPSLYRSGRRDGVSTPFRPHRRTCWHLQCRFHTVPLHSCWPLIYVVVAMIAPISLALVGVFSMVGPFWRCRAVSGGNGQPRPELLINSIGQTLVASWPYIIGLVRTSTGISRAACCSGGTLPLALSGLLVDFTKK